MVSKDKKHAKTEGKYHSNLTMKEITLDGNNFSNLKEFFDEVENKLTKGLTWKIGRNLNAYNDILRGGFGVHKYGEKITVKWVMAGKSKEKLGQKETVKYLKHVLKICDPSNVEHVKRDLEKMKNGKGKTLYKMILSITNSHDHVTLKLE